MLERIKELEKALYYAIVVLDNCRVMPILNRGDTNEKLTIEYFEDILDNNILDNNIFDDH